MSKELDRWNKIAGLPKTETKKTTTKKQLDENVVGVGAINPIFAERKPTDYEMAFEHYLGEMYSKQAAERDDADHIDALEKDMEYDAVEEGIDDLPETGVDVRDRTGDVRLNNLNLADDSEMVSRIEGLVNARDLGTMKDMLRILTSEWMQDGFEKEDIQDYITDFINKI